MGLRIAFSGKGGVGKTTIAGTLARLLARRGHRVVAVDGDLNPNLSMTLGVAAPEEPHPLLPRDVVKAVQTPSGDRRLVLTRPVDEILGEYAVAAPDGIRLLLMGRPGHAGFG